MIYIIISMYFIVDQENESDKLLQRAKGIDLLEISQDNEVLKNWVLKFIDFHFKRLI